MKYLLCRSTFHAVFLVVFMVLPVCSRATEYIVSIDGLGDFTTIADCVAVMQPGDRCTVWPGDYPERVTLPSRLSGTESLKTVFYADPPLMARTQGFDTRGCDSVRIEGFEIANDFTSGLETTGILIRSDHVEIVNNYVHSIRGGGIVGYWVQPWSNFVLVSNNRVAQCQSGINICGNNWNVTNNEVTRLVQYGPGDCDYSRFFGQDIFIQYNRFYGTRRSEIGTAHVDGFQTYDDNGEYCRNVTIVGNVVRDCHQGVMTQAKIPGNSSGLFIINNIFSDCWSWALDLHAIENVIIMHNVFCEIRPPWRWHSFGRFSRDLQQYFLRCRQ